MCNGFNFLSWIWQLWEGEGRDIDEGFSSSVYGFSLALQVRIWCIKSWEMGSYIVETATKKVTKLSHVFEVRSSEVLYESGVNSWFLCVSNSSFVFQFSSYNEVCRSKIPQQQTSISELWQLHLVNPIQTKPHKIHEHVEIKINKIQRTLSWN